jgi:hypothetical protein
VAVCLAGLPLQAARIVHSETPAKIDTRAREARVLPRAEARSFIGIIEHTIGRGACRETALGLLTSPR